MSIKCTRLGLCAVAALLTLLLYWRLSSPSTIATHPPHPLTGDSPHLTDAPSADGRVALSSLLSSAIETAQLGGIQVNRMSHVSQELNVRTKGKTLEGANDPVTDADLRSHCAMSKHLHDKHPTVRVISEEQADNAKCDNLPEIDTLKLPEQPQPHPQPVDVAKETDGIEDWVPAGDVTVWIDPLDATQEFTERLFKFVTVMVCVAVRGRPTIGVIYNPFTYTTHWAWHRPAVIDASLRELLDDTRFELPESDRPPAPPPAARNHTVIVSRSHYGMVSALVTDTLGAGSKLVYAGGAGYKVLQVVEGKADVYMHSTHIKKWDLCAGNAILAALGGGLTNLHGAPIRYAADEDVVNRGGVLAALYGHRYFVERLRDRAGT